MQNDDETFSRDTKMNLNEFDWDKVNEKKSWMIVCKLDYSECTLLDQTL